MPIPSFFESPVEPWPKNKNVKRKLDYMFSTFVEVGFAFLNYKQFAKYSQASIFIPVS